MDIFQPKQKWLYFLDKCTDYQQVPKGKPKSIRKAFAMMKIKTEKKATASSNEIEYKKQRDKEQVKYIVKFSLEILRT